MEKHNKKNNKTIASISLITGISLILLIGIIIGNTLINSNSYFARLKISNKRKVQLVYYQNLFDVSSNVVKEYDSDKQVLTLDGKLDGNSIELGKLNTKFNKGDRYRVIINYVSGSYDKDSEPQFVLELQKNNEYYENDKRANGTHYISGLLPSKKEETLDKVITIKEDVKDANNFVYRIYQNKDITYNDYKIEVMVTKVEAKTIIAGEKYGSMPSPEKEGYEFLGWYDSLSGGKKVTDATTVLKKYTHYLYAHWQVAIPPYKRVNYDNFKWKFYKGRTNPVLNYYKKSLNCAIWAPENASDLNGVSLPVIVWLHGMAERIGGDNENGLLHAGLPQVVSDWNKYGLDSIPALIIAPQSNAEGWNYESAFETIKGALNYLKDTYNVNLKEVALVGHSMGGYGAVRVSLGMPDTYKSVVIMSADCDDNYKTGMDHFKTIRLRGYSEHDNLSKFFALVDHPNDYYYLKGVKHGDVPREAFIMDNNNNKKSDLVEWLFYDK